MKGMFTKDLRLLTGGKESYFHVMFTVLFLGVLGIALDGDPGDNFSFECAVIAIMATKTKSYDIYDNGMAYLLTLPVGRKEYVRESYLFAVLVSVILTIVLGIMNTAAIAFTGQGMQGFRILLGNIEQSFGIVLIIIALLIPFEIQFGVKRSAYIILVIAIGVVMGLFLALDNGVFIAVMIQKGMGALIRFPVPWVMLAVSYLICVAIMERKDF
ncbi:MAG: ABC-2 transporter permease [Dorea sp.]|jgi:ABC-2 type transport system permease protein|nr:ABC-2 transporter permease [Dorea sp.]